MKVYAGNLSGKALNWAVSVALGYQPVYANGSVSPVFKPGQEVVKLESLDFVNDWALAGPLLVQAKISVKERYSGYSGVWDASTRIPYEKSWGGILIMTGYSYLEAAMRCFVVLHQPGYISGEIEVPDELLEPVCETKEPIWLNG